MGFNHRPAASAMGIAAAVEAAVAVGIILGMFLLVAGVWP